MPEAPATGGPATTCRAPPDWGRGSAVARRRHTRTRQTALARAPRSPSQAQQPGSVEMRARLLSFLARIGANRSIDQKGAKFTDGLNPLSWLSTPVAGHRRGIGPNTASMPD